METQPIMDVFPYISCVLGTHLYGEQWANFVTTGCVVGAPTYSRVRKKKYLFQLYVGCAFLGA